MLDFIQASLIFILSLKSDVFNTTLDILIDTLGGDMDDPKCADSRNSSTAFGNEIKN